METILKIRSFKGKIELEEYFRQVRTFHGSLAPGVVLGGFMVDWALEEMEPCEIIDAVVETRKCLPDAVQLLTKCSIGNGWMRILDWGKLALTLYSKETMQGVRVFLDFGKLKAYPLMRAWAMKERPKKENPLEPLMEEMIEAGRRILTCTRVRLDQVPDTVRPYGMPRICPRCGEPFRHGTEETCRGCAEPFLKAET